MKKLIYFVPTFIVLFMIFGFSSQNGQESGHLSTTIYLYLNQWIHLPFTQETMTFVLRKCAHMTEFGLLALSLLYGFSHVLKQKRYVISFILTVLLAGMDEYHQTFVSGRAGQVQDVLIDSTGALIALFLFYLIYHFIIIIKKLWYN